MDREMRSDWQEVVDLSPKGYCETQDHDRGLVFHGAIEKVSVGKNDDLVTIELKWVAQMGLPSTPTFGEWEKAPDENKKIVFPNLMVPFWIEDTPEKGKRVRFGSNLIYIDAVKGIDTRAVKGLQSYAERMQPAVNQPSAAPKAPRKAPKRAPRRRKRS